jgi:hypothetical protein
MMRFPPAPAGSFVARTQGSLSITEFSSGHEL